MDLPSRRRDLLVGVMTSTAIVCIGVYLSLTPPEAQAIGRPQSPPPEKPFPLPPEPIDLTDQPVVTHTDSVSAPDIPDAPRPVIDTKMFTVPVEPFHPAGPDMTKVPVDWSAPQPSGPIIFDPANLDQQPVARFQARPNYPYELKRDAVSGSVLVDFIVDTSGTVRNAHAISATNPGFEASAVDAVAKWKFAPGRKNGHAVYTHMQVPVEFRIEQ